MALNFTGTFSISGIALGAIIVLAFYHCVRPFAPAHMRLEPQGPDRAYEGGALISTGAFETPEGEESPFTSAPSRVHLHARRVPDLRKAWAPLVFTDENRPQPLDPVAPYPSPP